MPGGGVEESVGDGDGCHVLGEGEHEVLSDVSHGGLAERDRGDQPAGARDHQSAPGGPADRNVQAPGWWGCCARRGARGRHPARAHTIGPGHLRRPSGRAAPSSVLSGDPADIGPGQSGAQSPGPCACLVQSRDHPVPRSQDRLDPSPSWQRHLAHLAREIDERIGHPARRPRADLLHTRAPPTRRQARGWSREADATALRTSDRRRLPGPPRSGAQRPPTQDRGARGASEGCSESSRTRSSPRSPSRAAPSAARSVTLIRR